MWTSDRPDSDRLRAAPENAAFSALDYDAFDHPTREERHLSLFRVGALTVAGRRELCLIRNVSAGGMQIRIYSPIAQGTRVSVEFKQGDPITGMVKWIRDANAGVQFDRSVDIDTILSQPTDGPRPRMPRIDIDCLAVVREGARLLRTRARDISQGGLRIHNEEELQAGDSVVVSIGGLPAEGAVVRWVRDGEAGLAFNRVLSVPQLVEWLKQQERSGDAPETRAAG